MIGSTGIISIAMAAALLPTVSGYAQTIDPAIARLLHGGWPFVREIGVLLQRSNVYLDLSLQSLMMTPRTQ